MKEKDSNEKVCLTGGVKHIYIYIVVIIYYVFYFLLKRNFSQSNTQLPSTLIPELEHLENVQDEKHL